MINVQTIHNLEEKVNNLESIICRLLANDVSEEERLKLIESIVLSKSSK